MTQSQQPPLVIEPQQVTADWLNQLFRYLDKPQEVASVRSEAIGTGQSAHSERFHLTYVAGHLGPATLVGKFPSPDPTSRATGHDHGSYLREISFYRHIAPTVDIRLPSVIYEDFNPENSDFVLLMQDLAPAIQGDQMAGCDLVTARAALSEAANLHAYRWGDPLLPTFHFLSGADGTDKITPEMVQMFWHGFQNRYAEQLSTELLDVGVGLVRNWENYSASYVGPRTVTHGDYRLDNLLIDSTGSAVQVTSVDWQTVGVGCGAADVAYFIGAGLTVPDRRTHEMALLQHYLAQLKAKGVTGYEMDQLLLDYRRYSYAGFFMAVIASMLVVQTVRGDEMFMTMASRHGQQILDLDCIETIGG